ncbi:MAG: shikimate dehydrogenase [Candidatus Verstraetearchaeota archaeon]|nr:shikimate dehydrogenase [Candidatus Verstraetearchaeota archaeon]
MSTSRTRLFCIIGDPVEHSVSPEIFTRAFSARGMDAAYLAFRVPSERLGEAIMGLKAIGFAGCNVTIPHKLRVMDHLDWIDETARVAGAVNVVKAEGGRLSGYNTDMKGALLALEGVQLNGKRIAIVGYGGAARSVAFAISSSYRPKEVVITGRKLEPAESLARCLSRVIESRAVPLEDLAELEPDVIVNATPLGMCPDMERAPVDPRVLRNGMTVFDLVYNPMETKLLKLARGAGCRTVGGIEMLVGQAAAAFEIWTGEPAPVSEMREAAKEALGAKRAK